MRKIAALFICTTNTIEGGESLRGEGNFSVNSF